MKMPRSQCESENVQFVQELAEVDGPFEAPISINFRDLIKLELPSIVWNRGDTCPKKMKLTNTGHTAKTKNSDLNQSFDGELKLFAEVIVSGKWKCERPYLTGGPLLGKYVFSQIHFHWGQDDCKGSEHQICGEGFPLEMHVAHFKTEYLTQECALREKDGMVVVVYLFKLQDEPNQSLKAIINSLSNVKQPSTSQVIDPRPILSLCHPFTDDYFMYWGSVVTSTCAHILLWLICREPFGISREQVREFRKIMDASQQPICRNSKEVQPTHKRNVFHVNASKHLDAPLLPIRNLLGCYCRGNEDKDNVKHLNNCHCQDTLQNQEDVEGHLIEYVTENHSLDSKGKKVLQSTCFANQTFFVHTTQVQSVSILLKRCESDSLEKYCYLEKLKKMKSEGFKEIKKKKIKLISQSCCYLPVTEAKNIKNLTENRKIRKSKKLFDSVKAFSQIMQSLESLKNHTFKKLKEIESINQEVKEIKPYCQDPEDKKWIRKIENVMTGQKRLIIKSSHGCLSEIRKLAQDFNFDKFFDAKAFSDGNRDQKAWISTNKETTNEGLLCCDNYIKEEEMLEIEKTPSKYGEINNAIQFSSEAQKLVESFFEDIKDNEDLNETVKKDLNLKKIKSFYSRQGNSNSIINENKNYITQKMFTLGNLGNRFFTEVTTEDYNIDENQWNEGKPYEKELISTYEIGETKNTLDKYENINTFALEEKNEEIDIKSATEVEIPLHRTDVGILLSKTTIQEFRTLKTIGRQNLILNNEEKLYNLENYSDTELLSSDLKIPWKKQSRKFSLKKTSSIKWKNLKDLMCEKLLHALEAKVLLSEKSGSDFSTESTEIQRIIFAKIRQSKKDFREHKKQKSSTLFRISSKRFYNKANCRKFEDYYMQMKKPNIKRRKSHKNEKMKQKILYDLSSTSKEEQNQKRYKKNWKRLTRAKFKLEIQKTKHRTSETSIGNFSVSPVRKRLKLDYKKLREYSSRESSLSSINNNFYLTDKETRTIITNPEKESVETEKTIEQEHSAAKFPEKNLSEEQQKFTPESTVTRSRDISRSTTNKSLRASSAGSKLSHVMSEELIKPCTSSESLNAIENNLENGIPISSGAKLLSKNKSVGNLNNSPELTEILEPQNIRKKSNKESLIPRRKLEYPKKAEKGLKSINATELPFEISKEIHKEPVGEKDSKTSNQTFSSSLQSQPKLECKSKLLTTNSNHTGNELLPLNQVQLEKQKTLKHVNTKNFHVTEELKTQKESKGEHREILNLMDLNKSFKKNKNSLTSENKDFPISLSSSIIKNEPMCRPHSAESLPSQSKTLQRKGKKRPHCSKKNSIHFIRKNSSTTKRPNKAEKPLNFHNLTDEEQLKIISVNLVKYLEKLNEKNGESEKDYLKQDIPLIITEKIISKMNEFQKKKEKSVEKVPIADKNSDKKPGNAPAVKSKDKKEEKPRRIGVLRKPKVIRTPVKLQEEKSVPASPKPANNFIKLNKQMAGKYKKVPTFPAKRAEIKAKEKFKSEIRPSFENSKPKFESRQSTETSKSKAIWILNPKSHPKSKIQNPIPKKRKEETSSVNAEPKELISSKSLIPKAPKSSQFSPKKISQKESRLKTLRIYNKPDPNPAIQKPDDKSTSLASTKKSNRLVKRESNTETLLPSSIFQKIPRPKQHLNPNYEGSSCLPLPTAHEEDRISKTNAKPVSVNISDFQPALYDSKAEMQEEAKNDNLFQKELEYFIKLLMFLNSDLTKNLENPPYYEKSKLLLLNHQERGGATENVNVNYSAQNFESFIKQIITMETKDLMKRSSTGSNLTEEVAKHNIRKLETDNKSTTNVSGKTIQESNNYGIQASGSGKEKQEETNSDSSYDCKILITLNTNPKDSDNTVQSHELDNWLEENWNSQTTSLEGSSSQSTVVKPLRKKRNDGDIPIEMKEKLLEILEAEINREIAIKCGGSLVSCKTSNDWLSHKEDESDGNNKSRSTVSSCDNIEIFSQISNTMRQYLTYMKQLPDRKSHE